MDENAIIDVLPPWEVCCCQGNGIGEVGIGNPVRVVRLQRSRKSIPLVVKECVISHLIEIDKCRNKLKTLT